MSQRTLVIVDEAYLEYTYDFAARSTVELVRQQQNVVVFRTFSKAYGLAALPIGYALAPAPLVTALRAKGVGAPRSLNRLAVVAANAALHDQAHIAQVRQRVAAERALWLELFTRLGVRFSAARANFVFFQTGEPHQQFAQNLLARGVDIGRAFHPLEDWARITIGLPEENRLAREAVRLELGGVD